MPRIGSPGRRQTFLSLASLVLIGVFATRLIDVQIVSAAPLAEKALEQRLVTVDVTPPRANILDRNGNVLATSVVRYNLTVNQVKLASWKRTVGGQVTAAGPLGAAKILAPILGMSEAELGAALEGSQTFKYVAKNLTPEVLDLVKAERISGISWESTSERLYPNGDTAGNIIGYMAYSNDSKVKVGSGGIEQAFQKTLEGTPGSRTYEQSKYGTTIPAGIHSETPAVPGQSVVLTMDRDIQYYAEQRLARALSETGASAGAIVVTDPKTGETLRWRTRTLSTLPTRAPPTRPTGARGPWKRSSSRDRPPRSSRWRQLSKRASPRPRRNMWRRTSTRPPTASPSKTPSHTRTRSSRSRESS